MTQNEEHLLASLEVGTKVIKSATEALTKLNQENLKLRAAYTTYRTIHYQEDGSSRDVAERLAKEDLERLLEG